METVLQDLNAMCKKCSMPISLDVYRVNNASCVLEIIGKATNK